MPDERTQRAYGREAATDRRSTENRRSRVPSFWGEQGYRFDDGRYSSGLFVPYLRARFAHEDMNSTANLVVALALSGFALFSAIRPLQMHLTITNSQVEVVGAFSSHTVPFAEISGRRIAAGRGVSGMYLYRRGKSRVFLRESSLRLDDFYKQWKASIYDLDKADKLKRMEAGKERAMDFVFDDREQHPAIGGPDIIA